jgi:hypothetical protein
VPRKAEPGFYLGERGGAEDSSHRRVFEAHQPVDVSLVMHTARKPGWQFESPCVGFNDAEKIHGAGFFEGDAS